MSRQAPAKETFGTIMLKKDVISDFKAVSFRLTGEKGRRVTYSEALQIMVDNFWNKRSNNDTPANVA